jgi:hypothetical protein
VSKTNPVAKLTGNIIEHLFIFQDMKSEIIRYYHFDSKLINAIVDYIYHNSNNVFIRVPDDYFIECHRGTGAAISFKHVTVYKNYEVKPATCEEVFRLDLSITLTHDETEMERYENISFLVPVDLELNFTEEKFNKWIDGLEKGKNAREEVEELKVLEKLQKKYPNHCVTVKDN